MLKTLTRPTREIRWLIDKAPVTGTIVFVTLLIVACAVPVAYGPYYQPIYPEKSEYVWVPRDTEGAGPPASLRMRSGLCFMGLRAETDKENFTLSWTQEEPGERCQIKVHGNSLLFKDLATDHQWVVGTFRRVFVGFEPGLNIGQTVDIESMIPGFAAVPASERRYTLSIILSRQFTGPLPDTARIQLPDIATGERIITPPVLQLQRHRNELMHKDDYVPIDGRKLGKATLLSEFAGGSSDSVYIWHEENSLLRLAASFTGTPDSHDGYVRKNNVSEIIGRVYIEVLGDQPVRLTDGQVAWNVAGDKQDHLVPVSNSRWILEMYTTTNLSERIDHLPDYWQPDKTYSDLLRDYVVVIPGYQPKRFSVMLPHVFANEHEWPIMPIVFEYRHGSVGIGGL